MGEGGFPPQAVDPERNGTHCERGMEGIDRNWSPRTTNDIKKTSFIVSSWATAVCPDICSHEEMIMFSFCLVWFVSNGLKKNNSNICSIQKWFLGHISCHQNFLFRNFLKRLFFSPKSEKFSSFLACLHNPSEFPYSDIPKEAILFPFWNFHSQSDHVTCICNLQKILFS